ncbi:MAG: hypothetical protein HKN30_01655 [Sulfitobacter sp.]|nr:hypothetical protein [Sulfitobacter sp.]
MSLSPDVINGPAVIAQPMRMVDGSRMLLRLLSRMIGVCLLLAAFGLWLAPEASNFQEILLFKLALSICAALAGIGFLQSSGTPSAPEVQIDSLKREIRVVRKEGALHTRVLQRCGFDDLSRVERGGAHLRFWDAKGGFLAEVTLADSRAMESVLDQMRRATRRV